MSLFEEALALAAAPAFVFLASDAASALWAPPRPNLADGVEVLQRVSSGTSAAISATSPGSTPRLDVPEPHVDFSKRIGLGASSTT